MMQIALGFLRAFVASVAALVPVMALAVTYQAIGLPLPWWLVASLYGVCAWLFWCVLNRQAREN